MSVGRRDDTISGAGAHAVRGHDMRSSIRTWLASVGLMAGAGWVSVAAQSPGSPIPDPKPTNQSKAQAAGEKGKNDPKPSPNANLLPPVPELEAPCNLPGGCSTCGDVNANCADPGCAGDLIPGPKEPVWMSYTQLLLWFQPTRASFPLATGASNNPLITGEVELGKYFAYKLDGGIWLNHEHTRGIGADGFITEHRSKFRNIGGGIINRPFFDATTGLATALAVSNDPLFTGELATTNTARLASGGINLRRNVAYNERWQADIFYGFRYYDVDESLVIYQRTVLPNTITLTAPGSLPQTVLAGTPVALRDRSYTRNQFWGGEIGSRLEWKHGMTYLALTPKLAFGSIHQITQISGETRSTTPSVTVPGALLAAGANGDGNLGRFITNRFGVATDIGLQAGFSITKNSRIAIGYQFYYLNEIARPTAQFDQTVNMRVIPVSPAFGSLTGVRAPNVTFEREGFYAHGVSIAMEARY